MHKTISVAVPSRHRWNILKNFIGTCRGTTADRHEDRPVITVLHDAPDKMHGDLSVILTDTESEHDRLLRSVIIPDKSGLTRLYNLGIVTAPTDWVLLCNDDIEFKHGWLEYLESKIAEDKCKLITLFNFGAILIHKSVILQVGWFDERFEFGGYEDNDYQLRIAEAGLKHLFDRSHDFIKKDGATEVGHFVNHTKYVHNSISWHGDNSVWAVAKWGHTNYSVPVHRFYEEIDWYPRVSANYERKFNMPSTWRSTGRNSIIMQHGVVQ